MEIAYRTASPADAARLLDYLKSIGGESDNLTFGADGLPFTVEQEEFFLASVERNPRSCMLLALEGDEIVGSASVDGTDNPRFSHRRNLAISVRKSHWGKGIGSELIKKLIAFSRETGGEILSLEVRSDNTRAIALYRKFGFEKFGTYKNFFKIRGQYHDADYMNLFL